MTDLYGQFVNHVNIVLEVVETHVSVLNSENDDQ